jgi:nucleoside-diphosphate-sugar epimerase
MAETHVVLGAGALGSALCRLLVEAGHEVRVASRSGRRPLDAPPSVQVDKGDLTDEADARRLCEGATTVYFVAGPAYTDWPALFPPMYRAVTAGAGAAGARLVSCENVYPYGKVDGPMTEETPLQPNSKKGALRAEHNRQLLEAHAAGEVKVALVRGPDFYGPFAGRTTIYGDEVFGRAVAGKKANIFGDIDALHTFACSDDFARSMVAVGADDDAMGQTWHCVCPEPLTQRAMLEMIYTAVGQPMRAQALPPLVMTLLGPFMPIMRELKEMNYQWEHAYDFRCDKIKDAYGLTPTPHVDAVAQTVAWFRTRTS